MGIQRVFFRFLTHLCFPSTGVGLDPVYPHSVLCEGDHRCDPARRGPQRPGVVWSGGAAGLSAGGCHHDSSGQRVQLLLIRGPMQHKMPLNEEVMRRDWRRIR